MMQLVVQDISGRRLHVTVQPTATISDLKQRIARNFETTASRLKLLDSSGQILDNNQLTLSQFGLSSGSTVILLITALFQVFVKNEKGQLKMYDITEDETVNQLMTKVRQKEGTPEDQQRLIYDGHQLESGRKLQDYNIESGSTIHMTLRLRGG